MNFEQNTDIQKSRLEICYQCPLYTLQYGGMCNNKLWLNPETNDVSLFAKEGYYKGCGCILEYKTQNPESVCPLNKW